jgi:preprotein translocase subunit SecE
MAVTSTAISGSNENGKSVTSWLGGVREYFVDLRNEMRRVTWPNRAQVQATTGVVLAAIFLFAAYFAVVDTVLHRVVNAIFQALAHK